MKGLGGDGPVAIVAGSGRLPRLVVDSLERRGVRHRILALRGFADGDIGRRADAVVGLLDVGRALRLLDDWSPSAVALVGAVRRPKASAVLGAFSAVRRREELAELLARGDDHLLRGVVRLLEEHGHRVSGVGELAPELLVAEGVKGSRAPSEDAARAIAIGFDLLARLSPFDVGQGAVVAGERILAVEGPEGTDRMLARVRPRLLERLVVRRERRAGVLVKAAKRGQDLRVDLPAIGPRTLEGAARAGLEGIALGAGSALIIDQPAAMATADRLGLFLIGVDPDKAGEGPR